MPTLNHFLPKHLGRKSLLSLLSLSIPFAASANTGSVSVLPLSLGNQAIFSYQATAQPEWAQNGMVASQEAVATQVGVDILKQGGNAVDAAVAVGFALAVTLPRAGNIGGGGFMLYHSPDKAVSTAIDYREMAPAKAHKDIFLNDNGDVNPRLSKFHGLAVGVPGTVAGFELALDKYGTMSLAEVIAPAIKLAEDGIIVTPDLASSLAGLSKRMQQWPSTARIFYKADGSNYQPGDLLKQPELAESLKRIAKQGSKGFYEGETAQKLVTAVNQAGGIMSLDDMKNYRAVERTPVSGTYRGRTVLSMPPPSSGGVHIVQMLNILENFPLAESGHNSAETLHLMAETMKLAYADRSEYLGDPDFYPVPVTKLTDKSYAARLAASINPDKARPSADIKPGALLDKESPQTTHYSVVDKWGNAVSNTYTLNFSYGSGLVAEGTGILLNNEMDDFSAKPGVPNGFGLVGGEANAVEGGKRPLSSMSPTIVLEGNQPWLVTGSPGGSRIINTTLQMILGTVDFDLNVAEATNAPRVHHQWLPGQLRVERSLSPDTIRLLKEKGHNVEVKNAIGSTQSIMKTESGLYGESDPRRSGSATLGY
ncbi:gamma-glutamyltransferase [Shewanella submarina]|uniref:Glutathione hydrolase proenzyme n=1 Tax=Shewanella submarina TaxID=2016376 RepID=A0ABV7GEQ4_9GAMM|nr:gamma-glutamyltransferase [Shewanella submarina]